VRCACIDIGTNTTRLLVAERTGAGLRQVAVARAFVPLGPGAADPEAAATLLAEAVRGQLAAAKAHGASRIRVVGTAALRAHTAPGLLCGLVADEAGVEVEIIPPEEEARLAFLGATATLPEVPGATVAVVDVGGGSTELAVGSVEEGVDWWASVPVGSAVLTAAHVHGDPPGPDELDALRAAAVDALADMEPPRPDVAYAVGGSAASMPRVVGPEVTGVSVARAYGLLTAGPADAVARAHALDPRRVRMLPAGIALLAAARGRLGVPLRVAQGGLREGVVLDTGR
jgi:exopolyphosphatase / guanosine-5'-triphosphate,3'-diphosphate pyrophosphatase